MYKIDQKFGGIQHGGSNKIGKDKEIKRNFIEKDWFLKKWKRDSKGKYQNVYK